METEVEKLRRWIERDQAAIKALRRENTLLKGERDHFKAERDKMNRRYDNLMNMLNRWTELTWPWVFGEVDARDIQRTKELLASGVLPDIGKPMRDSGTA
jgi:hypothetical protein